MSEIQMTEEKENVKKGGFLRKLLLVLLGIVLVVMLCLVWLTSQIFAPWQEVEPLKPTFKDMMLQFQIMNKCKQAFDLKKNKTIPEKILLQLTPEEINAVFTIAGNTKPDKSPYPIRYYHPSLSEKGEFHATLPIRTPMESLWGGTIYVKVVFTVAKAPEGKFQCRVVSCKVTSLPISAAQVQKLVDKFLAEKDIREGLQKFEEAFNSISFENGKLQIEILPQKMMRSNLPL